MTRHSRLLVTSALVLIATLASACADDTTAPEAALIALGQSQTNHSPSGRPFGFTRCTPQGSDYTSARIGPGGGTLKAGRNTLRIPPGALKRAVVITMSAPSDSLNYVVFGPEGLIFDPAALPTLTMSYRNCSVVEAMESQLEIVYTDDALTTILDTTITVSADTVNHTVGAQLRHFSKYVLRSRYAVAY